MQAPALHNLRRLRMIGATIFALGALVIGHLNRKTAIQAGDSHTRAGTLALDQSFLSRFSPVTLPRESAEESHLVIKERRARLRRELLLATHRSAATRFRRTTLGCRCSPSRLRVVD